MQSKLYRPKMGILPLLLLFAIVIPFLGPKKPIIISIIFAIFLLSFFLLGYYAMKYVITGEKLKIKSLIYRKEIPIKEIHDISRSYELSYYPSFSLKRLEIKYGPENKYVLISPQKEMDFIEELHKINPKIKVEV